MKKAGPIILEPIMDVEVTTPQDHVGDVVGDLNRRRGQIQSQDSAGSTVMVRAHVPLKEMFGYISDLRCMTKGRASFTMQFHHYDPVPRNIADEIMAKSAVTHKRRLSTAGGAGEGSSAPLRVSVVQLVLPAELEEAGFDALQVVGLQLLEIEQRVPRALGHADQLVELDLQRVGVAVLGVLDQEHHQEGDDGRAGVDDELPGVAEAEDRPADRPQHDEGRPRG